MRLLWAVRWGFLPSVAAAIRLAASSMQQRRVGVRSQLGQGTGDAPDRGDKGDRVAECGKGAPPSAIRSQSRAAGGRTARAIDGPGDTPVNGEGKW